MKSLDTLVENLKNTIINEAGFNAFEYENNRIEKLEKRIANIKKLIDLKKKNPSDYKDKEDEIKKHTPNIDRGIFGASIENLQRKIQQLESQKSKSDIGSENDTYDPKEQAERNKMFGSDEHTQKMRAITKSKGKLWKAIVDYATVTGAPSLNSGAGISELLKKAEDAGKPITVKQAKEIIAGRSKKQQEKCEKYYKILSVQVDALLNIEEGKINDKDYLVQGANNNYFKNGQAVGKELKKLLPEIAPDKLNWDKESVPVERQHLATGEDADFKLITKGGFEAGERYNAFVYEKLRPYISSLREFAIKSKIAQTKDVVGDLLSGNKFARKSREEKLNNILDKDSSDEEFDKDFKNFRKSENELERGTTGAKDQGKLAAGGKFSNDKKAYNKAQAAERAAADYEKRKLAGGFKKINNDLGITLLGKKEFKALIDKWVKEGQKPDDKHKIYWMTMPSAGNGGSGAGKLALIYEPENKSDFNVDGWYGFKVHKNAFITSGSEHMTKGSYIIPDNVNLSIPEKLALIKKYEQYIEKVPKELKVKVKELTNKKEEEIGAQKEDINDAVDMLIESFFNY